MLRFCDLHDPASSSGASFRMAGASAKRLTGDEPQGTMGRVQTSSRLPLRVRFKERRLGTRQYMTRDINDTFVTNHPDDRRPSFAGSWRNTILISHIPFRNKSHIPKTMELRVMENQ